jgi:hypothetical protein
MNNNTNTTDNLIISVFDYYVYPIIVISGISLLNIVIVSLAILLFVIYFSNCKQIECNKIIIFLLIMLIILVECFANCSKILGASLVWLIFFF